MGCTPAEQAVTAAERLPVAHRAAAVLAAGCSDQAATRRGCSAVRGKQYQGVCIVGQQGSKLPVLLANNGARTKPGTEGPGCCHYWQALRAGAGCCRCEG